MGPQPQQIKCLCVNSFCKHAQRDCHSTAFWNGQDLPYGWHWIDDQPHCYDCAKIHRMSEDDYARDFEEMNDPRVAAACPDPGCGHRVGVHRSSGCEAKPTQGGTVVPCGCKRTLADLLR